MLFSRASQLLKMSFFTGATIRECLVYSKVMRIVYVIALCFTIGFLAPYFINQEMQFTEPSHDVLGTCHITMGLRTNCFPDLTNNGDPRYS